MLTPDGNWSSYPPHRHDGEGGCQVRNEEIYYFRVGRRGEPGYSTDGSSGDFGYDGLGHLATEGRNGPPEGGIQVAATV